MITFIVPAYNEAENLPTLLDGMQQRMDTLGRPWRILIVDDGSRDATAAIASSFASRFAIDVISHEANRGPGATFRTGFEWALARSRPDDIIVTKEADNTSDLSVLERMLADIESGSDVVLASCFAPQGGIVGSTWDRHLLSSVANLLLRTFFVIPNVHTYSSFYRAYRAGTLDRAFRAYDGALLECRGFACMVEMLVKLARLPIRITEVPMVLKCDLRKGASKMARLRTIGEYLRLIVREALRSRVGDRRVRTAFEAVGPSGVMSADV